MRVTQEIREIVSVRLKQQQIVSESVRHQRRRTIDTHEAVTLFHQLMKPNADRPLRIMYLTGDKDVGKTHLLKYVFPELAQHKYQARCIRLNFDLAQSHIHSISDILQTVCEQAGVKNCENYTKAQQEMRSQLQSDGSIASVLTDFADLNTSTSRQKAQHTKDVRLTTQLVLDLSKLNDKPLVFFFDTVNSAPEQIQTWLVETFLMKLFPSPHVRVVVASRTSPDTPDDYIDLLQFYQLRAINDEEEFILYCKELNKPLTEQNIRTLAREFKYRPGAFVKYLLATFGPEPHHD